MSDHELSDGVLAFVKATIESIEHDTAPPSSSELSKPELKLALALLSEMDLTGSEEEVDLLPLSEDSLSVELGLAKAPPPVSLDFKAVATHLANHNLDDLQDDLSRYGFEVDAEYLESLSSGDRSEVPPDFLRVFAAALGAKSEVLVRTDIAPLAGAHADALSARLPSPWSVEILDGETHVVSPDYRMGVLSADSAPSRRLDTLTVRRIAWELLTSRWIRHSACLVVSPSDAYSAIVIDASDCVAHQSAPTGLLSYGDIEKQVSIADALSMYEAQYQVSWNPPEPTTTDNLRGDLIPPEATSGIKDKLTGRFDEPKKSAFADVRDQLILVAASSWEPLAKLKDPDDLDLVEQALNKFLDEAS